MQKTIQKQFSKNSIRAILICTAIACLINLVVFLVVNKLNFVHFNMNDDFYIQNLINGSMGRHYLHFSHSNVAFSAVLSGLYSAIWQVNWYGLFLFVALLLSSGVIGGVLMDKFGLKLGLALYVLTLPLCFGLILTQFTYTLVCYAMLGCALVCLVYGFYMENKAARRFLYTISVIMLVGGVMLRKESVASAVVYCGAVALLLLIRYKKRAAGALLTLLIGFAVVGGLALADAAYFQSNPELAQYKRFHTARVDIMDHQPLDYPRYPEVFEQVGWSAEDANFFRNYFTYPDDPQFSEQNMEYIYDNIEPTRYNLNVPDVLQRTGNILKPEYAYILICLLVLMAVAFVSQKRKLFRAFTIVVAALPFLFQILFNVLWRDVFRAWYPHYLLSILLLLLLIDVRNLHEKMVSTAESWQTKNLLAGILAVVFVMGGIGTASLLQGTSAARRGMDEELQKTYGTDVQGIQQAFDTMYYTSSEYAFMYPTTSVLLRGNEAYSIFHAFPKDYFKNNRLLGGWDTRSPSYNDFKKRYGLESLPKDLIDSRVLLVSPDLTFLQNYYMEAYGINTVFETMMQLTPNLMAGQMFSIPAENAAASAQ